MSLIEVKNKKGTSQKNPPYGYNSWLDFWEKKTGRNAIKCLVSGCYSKAEIGGHIIKFGQGGKEYILPMCKSCNNKPEDEVFKADERDLVPVN